MIAEGHFRNVQKNIFDKISVNSLQFILAAEKTFSREFN